MKIVIDAMGGDNAPLEIVKGAVMAAEEFGVEIILAGQGETILRCLEKLGYKELPNGIEVAHSSQVVEMEDDPTSVCRHKPDSSMAVAMRMLKDGAADAMVSAGSTGALLSGSTLIVKRIRGIRRAAFAPFIPCKGGNGNFLLCDCGANIECSPEYLLQFAYMGSYYFKSIMKVIEPRVGLLNIGTEETKGMELQRESYKLLKKASDEGRINFVGNVEAREAMLGACDVLVCDGFSGNVLLKTVEGVGKFMISEMKDIFMANVLTKFAAVLTKKELKAFKKKVDVSEVGGTALLGISKPVIKAHGSCDAYAMRSSILQAINFVKSGITEDIKENIQFMRLSDKADE